MELDEIKEQLYARIEQIEDESLLFELNDLLKVKLENAGAYLFSPGQLVAIEQGRAEHKAGLGIPHEQVMKESELWLAAD